MKNYEKHEYNIMPKMADEQYNAIVYDMKNNGYKENQPVILYQNKIIDGWHRYKAAQDAGVSASYETFSGSNSEALEEVRRRNERRDLTSSQRAAVAVSYEKYFNDIADAVKDERAKKQSETLKSTYESGSFGVAGKKFPETKNDDYKTRTAVKIAKQFNTNDNYIKQAKKIKNENPDFFKKIIDGDKNFQDYKREVKGIAHVSHNSGENEWYTPSIYIESAREVMGSIDLDPASSLIANKTVKAKKYYTKDDDGLSKKWSGNVWMNPPYAQPLMSNFAEKISSENINQAIVLVNNATETKWFQRMVEVAKAICFPKGRIRFVAQDGSIGDAPLQGQAILYFGDDKKKFHDVFKKYGLLVFIK